MKSGKCGHLILGETLSHSLGCCSEPGCNISRFLQRKSRKGTRWRLATGPRQLPWPALLSGELVKALNSRDCRGSRCQCIKSALMVLIRVCPLSSILRSRPGVWSLSLDCSTVLWGTQCLMEQDSRTVRNKI